MNKGKFLIAGWAFAFLLGCGSPQTDSQPPTLASTAVVSTDITYTPQSDGGTDIIDDNSTTTTLAPESTAAELEPTATAIVLNTIVPTATPVIQLTPSPSGSNVPTLGRMQFSASQGGPQTDQFVSPNQVFVQFEYANVRDGAVLKRDWFFNNALFISREEEWDGAAYGENGVRNDISIFDYEAGLAAGVYQLSLFLDGIPQGDRTFIISAEEGGKPQSGEVKFSNLSFKGVGPYSIEIGEKMETPTELFAIWFYEEMSAEDTVRRDWYYNDELFITREEAWDFGKYSDSGLIDDVSIFDFETGLLPGDYRLELFVNDQFQVKQSVKIINAYELAALVEPVSGKSVSSDNINTVTVTNPDGTVIQKSVAGRIHSVDWFPGGDRIIFSATTLVDPEAPFPTFAHASELWLWDITADSITQLGSFEDRYHSPRVSPDGRRVAVLSGTGYGDAGIVDSVVIVFQFDESGNLMGTTAVTDLILADVDFTYNFPWTVNKDDTYRNHLVSNNFDWVVSPGSWINDTTLRTTLGFGGPHAEQHGVYDLNFDELTARKIE